jgi:probable O-glycosylation ligase (exosortase A-associated)
MWTIVAFLNPQSFLWASVNVIPWAQAVAVPTLLGLLVFAKGWPQRLMNREVLLIVILWCWFTVTTVISTNTPLFVHHADTTWYRWGFVSKILLMTLVTIGIVDSFARLRKLAIVIAGCFGVYVLKALPFLIVSRGKYRLYGPGNSMIADNNDFGLAMNMTLPLFLFLAQTESRPAVKRIFGLLFVLTIPVVFFTYSRGALLGMFVVLALMFLRLKQRLVLMPAIVLGLVVAVMFAPEAWRQRMDPSQSLDASALERLNAWAFARNLAAEFPITGGGFGTFTAELFARYAPVGVDIHGPHSVYFQVLGEHGFVGLVLYLALVASCFLSARRSLQLARWKGDDVHVQYADMFRLSLVAFLTSGIFLGRAYFDYFFTIVACLVILKRIVKEESFMQAPDAVDASDDGDTTDEILTQHEIPFGANMPCRTT